MTSPLQPSINHHAGIAALLEQGLAELGAAHVVYRGGARVTDGGLPAEPEYPHFVVWGFTAVPNGAADRLAGWGGDLISQTQLTAVGLTEADVLGGCDRAIRVLYRRRPVVAGRRCGDLDMTLGPSRPVADPDPDPRGWPVFTCPLIFELHSSPAT